LPLVLNERAARYGEIAMDDGTAAVVILLLVLILLAVTGHLKL